MADYIYLLENRLSPAQRSALRTIREIARSEALTIFLVGGAVRDLTSGAPVRDLDVVVQGAALRLRREIEKAGGIVTGQQDAAQTLFVRFPGNVRMEIGSTLSVSFPKPGKPVVKPATILDDLRRRDFTANAMALSLNEGSYGLLMDPLNGVADIENRQLRLVSNYGFIEDPVRMVRAARLMARLGWTLDEKTQARYETGQNEGYISAMSEFHRGYETEEIVHEEDPLRVLKRLEADGWTKYLAPFWTASKVNTVELDRLRDSLAQLQMQGISPDTAAVQFPLITAKLTAKEVATLKSGFPRQGFVREIDALESETKAFAAELSGKAGALPSHAWRLITAAAPEVVLSVAYSSRSPAIQTKFKSFFTEWPQARQKMPYVLMQEMRIVPEVPGYDDLLEKLFFELMDGKLESLEEMKAFLEPHSPPAPPPPVSARRPRATKKEAKPAKSRTKKLLMSDDAELDAADSVEIATVSPVDTRPIEAPELSAVKAARSVEEKPMSAKTVKNVPAKTVVREGSAKAPAKVLPIRAGSVNSSVSAKKRIPDKKAVATPKKKSPPAKKIATKAIAVPAKKSTKKSVPAKKAPAGKTIKAVVKAVAKKAAPVKSAAKKVAAKVPAKSVKRR